jgi:hypothetical protein
MIQAELAGALKRGELMIVLGAGVSAARASGNRDAEDIGLPNWEELVNRCLDKTNEVFGAEIARLGDDPKTSDFLSKMTEVKTHYPTYVDYVGLIRESLYQNKTLDSYADLYKIDLLIALGALMMGSSRGSVSDVVTYNFDDVLENYLSLHGFTHQVITEPMTLTGSSDVRIYHPHGFLPLNDDFSVPTGKIIFDQISFDQRIGSQADAPWRKNLELLLSTKTTIFIGLSGDDPTFGPLFASAAELVGVRDPLCYWFRKNNEITHNLPEDTLRKIMPINVSDYDDIPKFLFGICQRAAKIKANEQ